MRKTILGTAMLFGLALAACSSTSPTAEVIVVTATVTPTEASPTEVPVAPTPDDGNPAVFLAIISPGNGSSWESTDFVEVTGSARGQPTDDVVVFFIDEGRNIYGYACAQLGAPNANNIKTYTTRMTAPVNVDTAGKIIAANIADDGGIAGSAGVFSTALKDNNDKHVTIGDDILPEAVQFGMDRDPRFSMVGNDTDVSITDILKVAFNFGGPCDA